MLLTRILLALPVCLVALVHTNTATADDEITATIGDRRVKATIDTGSRTVRAARIERKTSQGPSEWTTAEVETEAVETTLEAESTPPPVSFADCNDNGRDDLLEIEEGSPDLNINLVPDSCEYGYGDLNLDGDVDERDMFVLLGWFAAPFPIFGDLNEDGQVDSGDMGFLLARWGRSPF